MPSLLDGSAWLDEAEKARYAAERLTDPEAKQVMLQLCQHYLCAAEVELARARAGKFAFVPQPTRPADRSRSKICSSQERFRPIWEVRRCGRLG